MTVAAAATTATAAAVMFSHQAPDLLFLFCQLISTFFLLKMFVRALESVSFTTYLLPEFS